MESQGEFLTFLAQKGILNPRQSALALKIKQEREDDLFKILIEKDFLSAEILSRELSEFYQMPVLDWQNIKLDETCFTLLPRLILLQHTILPLNRENNCLSIAISQRPSQTLIEDLSLFCPWEIRWFYAAKTIIEEKIFNFLAKHFEEAEQPFEQSNIFDLDWALQKDYDGAELILSQILDKAITLGASDVHLERFSDEALIKLRIDGFLYRFWQLPEGIYAPLVNIIKLKSALDIAQSRSPQDGHFRLSRQTQIFDVRVATLPLIHGEKVVMRLLGAKPELLTLEALGFSEKNLNQLYQALSAPYGLILLTGPTNSGKSTTLYAMLNRLKGQGKNIMTIEDPVEYELKGINQMQINEKAQLTFAKGLRGILRQDPDIIMIGELRDRETAAIAIRAANTGHLVLASLHTNDAFSALLRLLEMGIEPFLLTNALLAVVAQRLVRKNCDKCLIETTEILSGQPTVVKRGQGCAHCHDLGYKGRLALQEVWLPTSWERQAVLKGVDIDHLRQQAHNNGFVDIWQDGLAKVQLGLTTYQEILLTKS